MIDFTPVRDAQLGATDLARLVGMSRVTVSLWLNNHTQPIHLISDKVASTVDAIKAAVDAGLLPVPHSVVRRERGHYIKTVIEQVSQ